MQEVEDGTVVRVSCGNEENCCGEVGSVFLVPTTKTTLSTFVKLPGSEQHGGDGGPAGELLRPPLRGAQRPGEELHHSDLHPVPARPDRRRSFGSWHKEAEVQIKKAAGALSRHTGQLESTASLHL